jgi:HAD superfamily hydrolase (TIGR01509 family)
MLKAILFDLGDTLFDTQPTRLWNVFEAGAREGYAYLQSLGHKLPSYGRFYPMHRNALQKAFIWSRLTGGEVSCGRVLRKLSLRLGLQLTAQQLDELGWRWYMPVMRRSRVDAEVRPTLARLRDRGLTLAIVSNTFVPGAVLDRHLEIEGLLEFFPHRLYSSELGLRKPNPRIFQIALTTVDVRADEAVFVGDNLRNDIAGAQRCGMLAILKDPRSDTRTHAVANHVVRNIRELYQLLPLLGAPARRGQAAGDVGELAYGV